MTDLTKSTVTTRADQALAVLADQLSYWTAPDRRADSEKEPAAPQQGALPYFDAA